MCSPLKGALASREAPPAGWVYGARFVHLEGAVLQALRCAVPDRETLDDQIVFEEDRTEFAKQQLQSIQDELLAELQLRQCRLAELREIARSRGLPELTGFRGSAQLASVEERVKLTEKQNESLWSECAKLTEALDRRRRQCLQETNAARRKAMETWLKAILEAPCPATPSNPSSSSCLLEQALLPSEPMGQPSAVQETRPSMRMSCVAGGPMSHALELSRSSDHQPRPIVSLPIQKLKERLEKYHQRPAEATHSEQDPPTHNWRSPVEQSRSMERFPSPKFRPEQLHKQDAAHHKSHSHADPRTSCVAGGPISHALELSRCADDQSSTIGRPESSKLRPERSDKQRTSPDSLQCKTATPTKSSTRSNVAPTSDFGGPGVQKGATMSTESTVSSTSDHLKDDVKVSVKNILKRPSVAPRPGLMACHRQGHRTADSVAGSAVATDEKLETARLSVSATSKARLANNNELDTSQKGPFPGRKLGKGSQNTKPKQQAAIPREKSSSPKKSNGAAPAQKKILETATSHNVVPADEDPLCSVQ